MQHRQRGVSRCEQCDSDIACNVLESEHLKKLEINWSSRSRKVFREVGVSALNLSDNIFSHGLDSNAVFHPATEKQIHHSNMTVASMATTTMTQGRPQETPYQLDPDQVRRSPSAEHNFSDLCRRL